MRLVFRFAHYPGRCPGLKCFAPSGRLPVQSIIIDFQTNPFHNTCSELAYKILNYKTREGQKRWSGKATLFDSRPCGRSLCCVDFTTSSFVFKILSALTFLLRFCVKTKMKARPAGQKDIQLTIHHCGVYKVSILIEILLSPFISLCSFTQGAAKPVRLLTEAVRFRPFRAKKK